MMALERWWSPETPARRLAAVRIVVGLFAAGYLLARAPHLLSYARFNPDLFQPVGVVSILGQPLPAIAVYLLTGLTLVTSVAFVLGYKFRWVGPLFSILLLWTLSYRNSWRMVFHTENLMVLHVMVLGLAPSADAWSIDSRGHSQSGAGACYGWPLRLMGAIVVLAYAIAGIAKFRWGGTGWLEGDVLRNLVATDTVRKILLGSFYSPVAGSMVDASGAFKVFAIATVILELGAPVVWLGRRWAALWCLAIIGFHWGVQVIMMITFPYPMFGFAFACLFPIDDWWVHWRERRRAKKSK